MTYNGQKASSRDQIPRQNAQQFTTFPKNDQNGTATAGYSNIF